MARESNFDPTRFSTDPHHLGDDPERQRRWPKPSFDQLTTATRFAEGEKNPQEEATLDEAPEIDAKPKNRIKTPEQLSAEEKRQAGLEKLLATQKKERKEREARRDDKKTWMKTGGYSPDQTTDAK